MVGFYRTLLSSALRKRSFITYQENLFSYPLYNLHLRTFSALVIIVPKHLKSALLSLSAWLNYTKNFEINNA